jgi:hypothetical protein
MASKHRNETNAARIGRLVKSAFREAEIGNDGSARSFWAAALKAGYTPDERSTEGLRLAIAKGLRETRR